MKSKIPGSVESVPSCMIIRYATRLISPTFRRSKNYGNQKIIRQSVRLELKVQTCSFLKTYAKKDELQSISYFSGI